MQEEGLVFDFGVGVEWFEGMGFKGEGGGEEKDWVGRYV